MLNSIQIFEESCKHGSFPRYSVTTTPVKTKPGDTNGHEQHTFRVRLSLPEWNIHRVARSGSFPNALAQVTTYIRRRLDRLGKHWTQPDESNSMFKNLDFDAALIFLRFATQKLNMKGFYLTPLKLDVPGPQHIHKVQQRSLGIAPHQPMLRKRDARKIAVMTAAIRFIHNFGPESLDGFEEVLQDIKAEKAASKAEAEKDGIERSETPASPMTQPRQRSYRPRREIDPAEEEANETKARNEDEGPSDKSKGKSK